MKFTYTPEGGEPRSWDFKPRKLLNVESELIEDVTGWTYQEFGEKFMAGSTRAYHALLWILLKRTTPGLKYDAVQFSMDEVDVEPDDEEKRAMFDLLAEDSDLTDDQRDALREILGDQDTPAAADPKGSPESSDGGGGSGQ